MKLKPLFDRVILDYNEQNENATNGILLLDSAKEKPLIAKVLAVGKGGKVDGEEVEMQVSVGDKVLYNKYAGSEITLDKKKYIVIKQTDILAVVEKED